MKKHFVTFFSPGTFVSETTTKPIESWDVDLAVKMSETILERYDARPYGFRFSTWERNENELDSHETAHSPMYHLGGQVFTLQELKDKNDPEDRILILNMECNGWDKVIVNTDSWKHTSILEDGDIIL